MDIQFRRILCPVDFSPSSEYAVEYALAIAARCQATVEILHVEHDSAYAGDDVDGRTYEDSLSERLDRLAANAGGVPVQTHLATGIPFQAILARAEAWGADLLVIGTHGRTGIKHLLIGSVAERVVRAASCPVCTVRHPDYVVNVAPQPGS